MHQIFISYRQHDDCKAFLREMGFSVRGGSEIESRIEPFSQDESVTTWDAQYLILLWTLGALSTQECNPDASFRISEQFDLRAPNSMCFFTDTAKRWVREELDTLKRMPVLIPDLSTELAPSQLELEALKRSLLDTEANFVRNIAVIGKRRCGKTTFVNALLQGLDIEETPSDTLAERLSCVIKAPKKFEKYTVVQKGSCRDGFLNRFIFGIEVAEEPTIHSMSTLLQMRSLIETLQYAQTFNFRIREPVLKKIKSSIFGDADQEVLLSRKIQMALSPQINQELFSNDQAIGLDGAIATYKAALAVLSRDTFPVEWAYVQRRLGNIYKSRLNGDRNDNLEQGILAYKACLKVFSSDAFPLEWARTHYELGSIYANRVRGRRSANLEIAKAAFEAALTVFSTEVNSIETARAQCALADTLQNGARGESADNIERAIQLYEAALTVIDFEEDVLVWAQIQNNIASAFLNRIHGERVENIERAINAYQAVLSVLTSNDHALEWARSKCGLGSALQSRIYGDHASNLELAIGAYVDALSVYSGTEFALEWGVTNYLLAGAYWDRICGSRADNLELTIQAYEAALSVLTPEARPTDWAHSMNNLALAYQARIQGDRARNLELAISNYEAALSVFNRKAFPIEWSKIQINLSRARDEQKIFDALVASRDPGHTEDINSRVVVLNANAAKERPHAATNKTSAYKYERRYFDNERTLLGLFMGVPAR